MDPVRGDHYEVLGIEPSATGDEVEEAYRRCVVLYGEGSLATYSLLEAEEVEAVRARVREAYEVLRDPERRRDYDAVPRRPEPAPAAPRGHELPRSEPKVLPDPVTGPDLRRVREARGVALKDIARASRIGVRFLEYIEADRHADLPAAVYLRGFVQEYARAVGLDPQRTAASYLAHAGSTPRRSEERGLKR
jgi:flagellar biosynthesis protein FlhG